MNVIHRSKLKHMEFTLATGDIFDASVDAIVNSEQTGSWQRPFKQVNSRQRLTVG